VLKRIERKHTITTLVSAAVAASDSGCAQRSATTPRSGSSAALQELLSHDEPSNGVRHEFNYSTVAHVARSSCTPLFRFFVDQIVIQSRALQSYAYAEQMRLDSTTELRICLTNAP
jgi:hypothetical protein